MLAGRAEVILYPVREGDKPGIRRGYISYKNRHTTIQRRACVIGASAGAQRFIGRIVATVTFEKGNTMIVVARQGKVYYEPVIRDLLSLPNTAAIRCQYEKSCGCVVYRTEERELKFLVVRNLRGKNWGFPKGHVELNETEEETAKREVLEETGLHIHIEKGFSATSRYNLSNGAIKQVVFFVGTAPGEHVVLQESEIEQHKWISFEDCMKLFRFENDRRVLRKANDFIYARRKEAASKLQEKNN